jgi:hypothetical protein
LYRVAGESLLVETQDAWAAAAIDALVGGWYVMPDSTSTGSPATPAIVMSSETSPPPIPPGLERFDIAGGGTCYTDGTTSYLDIDGSVVAIGKPGVPAVEVRIDGPLALDAPALTRVVSYALSAALRRRQRFELHSAALVDPESGKGVLIVGRSGSGKSTLAVHLASAGWPFLTDDVLVLSQESARISAWPLRRCFAVTVETLATSRALQARTALNGGDRQRDGKQHFLPHGVFPAEFTERCVPGLLLFPTLTGVSHSRVEGLSPGDALARLIRMSPWSCYDRGTASAHLTALSMLAKQASGHALLAGLDMLDPEASVRVIEAWVRES